MTLSIAFFVSGAPMPQGSKIALISGKRQKRGGAVWVRNPIASMVEQGNRKTKTRARGALDAWRGKVAEEANAAMEYAGLEQLEGGLNLSAEFILARPPSHFTTKGALRKSARQYPGKPDLSKLVRAVEDAMSGTVYRDDAQIVSYEGTGKYYAPTPGATGGVHIEVRAV